MSEYKYRLIVEKTTGSGKLAGDDCHKTKSVAGHLFHQKNVKSVTVADITGRVFLYLSKERPESNINVSSDLATY